MTDRPSWQVAAPAGHLVMLKGRGGLEERLTTGPPRDLPLAPRRRISPVEARALFGRWLPPQGLRPFYHVFVSYRWGAHDSELVDGIFSRLCVIILVGGREIHVFVDRKRLEDARDFSTDFATGLINSRVAVPIVSYAALERMFALTAESNVDNVLLEWTLIKELMDMGHLVYCLPVMLGKVTPDATDGEFVSNLFALGALDRLPEVVCVKVADRVKELLEANGMTPSASLHTSTVRDVVKRITRALGVLGWDVNNPGGESSSHGGASRMHSEAKWKQKLVSMAVSKTVECVERAVAAEAAASPAETKPAAVSTPAAHAEIQEEEPGASSAAQAAGGPVRGDSTLRREMSQLRRNEHEAQMQAELARKDAEIERARMEAEMARKEAEAEKKQLAAEAEAARKAAEAEAARKEAEAEAARKAAEAEAEKLKLQLEIERLRNQVRV